MKQSDFINAQEIAALMSDNEFKITLRTEFLSLLGKAYWLESQFENIMQWQAVHDREKR